MSQLTAIMPKIDRNDTCDGYDGDLVNDRCEAKAADDGCVGDFVKIAVGSMTLMTGITVIS